MKVKRRVDTNLHPMKRVPKTTARGEDAPRKSRARASLPLTIGRAYERFLERPPMVVLVVLWTVGTALFGSIALALYLTAWMLLQLAPGFI
jgi:hypothetical protein